MITAKEAFAWLDQASDAYGECDDCHSDASLWELPEEWEPDAWMLCRKCFRKACIKEEAKELEAAKMNRQDGAR